MPSIAICNLGCSKNQVDGERILASFAGGGYRIVDDFSIADVILVNTCAFIKEAKEEAIDSILEMASFKKDGSCKTLAVAGCFSQRYREEARKELPEVDLWLGVDSWATELDRYLQTRITPSQTRVLSSSATQYLKIAEGCSHRCSFCVIPSIRGDFRSRPIEEIIDEAKWLADQGTKECILVSQDTAFYGKDANQSLVLLVEELLQKTTFAWIRLMYLNPQYVDERLLQLVASEERICSYFDIPMQHGSDKILRAMRRPTSSEQLKETIAKVRTIVPGATVRSSFIVGFPGETEKDFQKLIDFVEWAQFDKLGVFPFSPEEGTHAYDLRPRPRNATVMQRCDSLMDIQRSISGRLLEKRRDSVYTVLIEHSTDGDEQGYEGRSQYDAPEVDGRVFVMNTRAEPGDFVRAKIIDSDDYDLFAEPVNE